MKKTTTNQLSKNQLAGVQGGINIGRRPGGAPTAPKPSELVPKFVRLQAH